ncbi:hypothetical protein RB595_000299 [Gaeumannomyces hyphopodioides]
MVRSFVPLAVWTTLLGTGWTVAKPTEAHTDDNATYDYIIVGGGTAGAALATRLSQGLPSASILLLEAGPAESDDTINIPGFGGRSWGGRFDWNLTSVAQSELGGRKITHPRGHILGGSSALNLMVWDHGSRQEYDAWEELGNPGWNWGSMFPAMLRAHNFTRFPGTYGDEGVGFGGPVQTVIPPPQPESMRLFFTQTFNAVGVPSNLESLGGNPIGAMRQPRSIDARTWTRSTSASAYLPLAGPGLKVQANSPVAKVDLRRRNAGPHSKDRESLFEATGVTLADGTKLHARREVVLSAGAFHSPALLEASGVGQAGVLAAAGVPQLLELPGVGENLQDHIRVNNVYQLAEGFKSLDELRYNATYAAEQLALYRAGQQSALREPGSAIVFATWAQAADGPQRAARLAALADEAAASASASVVVKKKAAMIKAADPTNPELEGIWSDSYSGAKGYPQPGTPLYGRDFFSLLSGVMQPLSVGSVHLQPGQPSPTRPAIDFRYFSARYDLAAVVEGARWMRRVAGTQPLQSGVVAEAEPGLDLLGPDATDAQWEAWARQTMSSIFHPAGSCAMLPRRDGGVVDPALKVYGTANLRVVDASVMPLLVSGHIQSAVYGIAERAAELIIRDCAKKRKI